MRMRYLLDTVVISELRKGRSRIHPGVASWQKLVSDRPVYLSVVTLHEIRLGIRQLERRDTGFAALLSAWYQLLVAQPERFMPLGVDAPIAELAADWRYLYQMAMPDALIAATASVHQLTLVTRNTSDFVKTGIPLLNPWED